MQTSLSVPTSTVMLDPGEGRAFWVGGFRHVVKVDGAQTGGAFSVVEVTVAPGGGTPPHRHEREAEAFFVAEGAFEFACDGETFLGERGAFVLLPAGTTHAFRSLGPAEGRLVVCISPAGFERYFEEVGTPVVAGEAPPPVDGAALGRMLGAGPAYGLTFMGAPPPDL